MVARRVLEPEADVAVSVCPWCLGIRTTMVCPCRVEKHKREQGIAADTMAGNHPMSGKPAADLPARSGEDLWRAIHRTVPG